MSSLPRSRPPQYREHLDREKRKKQSAVQGEKRKAAEHDLADLKKKRKTLQDVTVSLEEEGDKLAEQAEGKAGTLMARLITKSNLLRRKCKENSGIIKKMEADLEAKASELRRMP